MGFFEKAKQPAKFEAEVIEKRPAWNKGLPLTKEAIEKARLKNTKNYYQGKSYSDWAAELGCSVHKLGWYIKEYGNLDKLLNPKNKKTYQGKTYAEWAAELGVSETAIKANLKKFGTLDRLGKELHKIQYQGKSTAEWAAELGCSQDKIRHHLKKFNTLEYIIDPEKHKEYKKLHRKPISEEGRRNIGEAMKKAFSNPEYKQKMKEIGRYKSKTYQGKTYAEWAAELNIKPGTVGDHIRRHGNLDKAGIKAKKSENVS